MRTLYSSSYALQHNSLKRNTHSVRFRLDGRTEFGTVTKWLYDLGRAESKVYALVEHFASGSIKVEPHRYLKEDSVFPLEAICNLILVPLSDILHVIILLNAENTTVQGFPCYQLVKLVYDTDEAPYENDNAQDEEDDADEALQEAQEIM